mgnify:CR=1 FL=1
MKPLIISLLMAATAMAGPAQAQNAQPDAPIDDAARAAVVRSLGEELRRTYVFPEVAEQVSQELTRRERANAYDDAGTAQAFASRLTADLHEVGKDRHLGVYYSPDFAPPPRDGKPAAEQLEQAKTMAAQQGYGIRRVLRLSGNIGYLDIVGFGQPEAVAAAYEAAAQLLAGSDAVIVDLRSNGGGDPESVAQLMSHFFAEGDVRHINSIYNRPTDTTREYWTDRTVETRYTGPVFVLTSSDTFSGGEEFAYDMQTQKRGTLIGETTGGGLSRLPALLKQHQPELVIVELGGNDGLRGYPLNVMKQQLAQIVDTSRNAGAQVLLVGMQIPPNYGVRYTNQFRDTYTELAEQYDLPLVEFLLADVALNRELMQKDGIHPTAQAQEKMLDNVWSVLQPMLERLQPLSENGKNS